MATSLVDDQGRAVTLAERLGRGGEGEVFAVQGAASVAAKILFPARRTKDARDKVRAMIARPPTGAHDLVEGFPVLSWPQRALFADGGKTYVGYTMVRVHLQRDFVPLYQVSSSGRREGLGGMRITWDRLVTLGLRIAHVVRTLHGMGYAVGDLNDRNILVSRRLTPLFLDTDSFQVPRPMLGHFPCAVGDALYWPPELLKVDLSKYQGSRIPADRYALAVLLFQLFLNGMRPYQARGSLVDGLDSVEKKTEAGHYPWAKPKKDVLEPPAGAPPYTALPPSVRRGFEAAFVAGHRNHKKRPSAEEWVRTLKTVRDAGFRTCTRRPEHRYPATSRSCPWCDADHDPFVAAPKPRKVLRRARRVRTSVRKLPPRRAPAPATPASSPRPPPRPEKRFTPAELWRQPAPASKPSTRARSGGGPWIASGAWNSGLALAYYSPVFFVLPTGLGPITLAYLAILCTLAPLVATVSILGQLGGTRRRGRLGFVMVGLLAGILLTAWLVSAVGWIAAAVVAGLTHLLFGLTLYAFLERRRRHAFRPDGPGVLHGAAGLVASYLPLAILLALVA